MAHRQTLTVLKHLRASSHAMHSEMYAVIKLGAADLAGGYAYKFFFSRSLTQREHSRTRPYQRFRPQRSLPRAADGSRQTSPRMPHTHATTHIYIHHHFTIISNQLTNTYSACSCHEAATHLTTDCAPTPPRRISDEQYLANHVPVLDPCSLHS